MAWRHGRILRRRTTGVAVRIKRHAEADGTGLRRLEASRVAAIGRVARIHVAEPEVALVVEQSRTRVGAGEVQAGRRGVGQLGLGGDHGQIRWRETDGGAAIEARGHVQIQHAGVVDHADTHHGAHVALLAGGRQEPEAVRETVAVGIAEGSCHDVARRAGDVLVAWRHRIGIRIIGATDAERVIQLDEVGKHQGVRLRKDRGLVARTREPRIAALREFRHPPCVRIRGLGRGDRNAQRHHIGQPLLVGRTKAVEIAAHALLTQTVLDVGDVRDQPPSIGGGRNPRKMRPVAEEGPARRGHEIARRGRADVGCTDRFGAAKPAGIAEARVARRIAVDVAVGGRSAVVPPRSAGGTAAVRVGDGCREIGPVGPRNHRVRRVVEAVRETVRTGDQPAHVAGLAR